MQKNKIKISVVTVSYNAVKEIEETILSVVNQTYDNIEYIIIDGGSTDGTVDIIKKYANGGPEFGKHNHNITYWVSELDKGIFDAMNKGIDIATGNYINFMNAGDKYCKPDTLEDIYNYIGNSLYIGVIYGQTLIKDSNRKLKLSIPSPFFISRSKFAPMGFCHQSTIINTDYCKKFKYDCEYRLSSDYDMIRKIYNNNGRFVEFPNPIAIYDYTGISSNNWENRLLEESKICKVSTHSLLYKLLHMKYYIFNNILKFMK